MFQSFKVSNDGIQNWKFQSFKVSKFQSFKVFKVSKFQCFKVSKFEDVPVLGLEDTFKLWNFENFETLKVWNVRGSGCSLFGAWIKLNYVHLLDCWVCLSTCRSDVRPWAWGSFRSSDVELSAPGSGLGARGSGEMCYLRGCGGGEISLRGWDVLLLGRWGVRCVTFGAGGEEGHFWGDGAVRCVTFWAVGG